jgi:integrase
MGWRNYRCWQARRSQVKNGGWKGTSNSAHVKGPNRTFLLVIALFRTRSYELCLSLSSSAGRGGYIEYHLYDVNHMSPIGSWKRAWKYACVKAGVRCRWHDLRHTFISRLAENPTVSEETIRALAGHVSKQLLQRYSHIRNYAKEAAISGLENDEAANSEAEADKRRAQNRAQSPANRLN